MKMLEKWPWQCVRAKGVELGLTLSLLSSYYENHQYLVISKKKHYTSEPRKAMVLRMISFEQRIDDERTV